MGSSGWETDYIVPGGLEVRLTLFWGDNYFGAIHKDCIATMRKMLGEHGMKLSLIPANGEMTDQFSVKVPVKEDGLLHPEGYNELRNNCAAKFDDQAVAPRKQRLPVIFCNFKFPANGLTVDAGPWPAWCMVGPTSDSVTMLHESGHASPIGPDHLTSTSVQGGKQNFMFDGGGDRSLMHKAQLQKYAGAYFIK
jgi:hypothetical protein